MKNNIKRLFSFIMAVLMIVTIFPTSGFNITAKAASDQYALPPMDNLIVSQTYYGKTSHYPHTYGNIVDYPIDLSGKDLGQDVFKAPFDLKIVNTYTQGTNTFWFESINPVICADGTRSIVCGQVTHPNDKDMPKKGQTFRQGEVVTKEGTDGCTGNHIHLSLGKGHITNNGWKKNNNGKWVLTCTGGTFKPEEILFVTDAIYYKPNSVINWVKLHPYKDYSVMRSCDKLLEANENTVIVREGPAKKYKQIDLIPKGKVVHATGYYLNHYQHIWYMVEYDGKTGWIYSERLKNIPTYKVSYNVNGGQGAPSTQYKKKDAEIAISNLLPTRENYQFVGWSSTKVANYYTDIDSALQHVDYKPGDKYNKNKNLSLYAVWHETKTSVSLSANKVDLCLTDNKTATVDVTIKGIVKDGYKVEFSAVDKVTAKSSNINISKYHKLMTLAHIEHALGKATITLTAKEKGATNLYVYVKNEKGEIVATSGISINVTEKYYITYDANGGTGAPAKQVKISGKNQYISSNVPTYENKAFLGWAVSGSDAIKYGPGDIYNIDSDITLVAQWGQNYYTKATLSENNTVLTITGHGDMPSYGLNSYTNSKWHKYASTVKKIILVSDGNGQITSIGSYAFAGFNQLTSVEMPYTVSRIHSYAFYNCGNLVSVSVPEQVTIGSYAFANCGKLSKYIKTTSPKSSPYNSYANMSVENDAGSIGAFAFENCVNLQSIDLSDVPTVSESAFAGCTSLNDVILSDELNVIESCVFYNCSELEKIEIPDSVEEIRDGAFSGCKSLENVELPNNIEVIGEQAFGGCSSIESIEIPESVEFIGSSAFANCTSLKDVDLPDNTFCLSDSMFSGCTSMQSINIPDSVIALGDGTFFGCTGLNNVNIPKAAGEIGDNTFAYCHSLTNIDIPDSVTTIKDFAFFGCAGLNDIKLSINLDSIGSYAFANCTSLQSISFPGSLSVIKEAAFADCTSLKNVDFEESMISIESEAFAGCKSLNNIKIPECASYISSTAFNNCSSSMSVTCYSTSDVYSQISNSGLSFNTLYPVEGLDLSGDLTSLKKGETLQLNPTFTPSNATNKSIQWYSQNEDVATVSDTGLVTAKGTGNVVIVAITDEGHYEATYEINCVVPVEEIKIVNDFEECYVGSDLYIACTFNPTNPTNIDLIYKSSNEEVATVDEDGFLSIVGQGSAIIDIISADGNAKKSIEINAQEFIPIESIELSFNSFTLNENDSIKLSATITPSNATNKDVLFYSENDEIATVDQNGVVKAVKAGTTRIICVNDEIEVVCTVTVQPTSSVEPEYNFTFSIQEPSMTTIRHKDGIKLRTNIEGTAPEGCYVEWTSDNGKFRKETLDNGRTLKIISDSNGKTVFTATLYDAQKNVLATDTIEMNSKAGFFDKIGSFFRGLFGMTKVYEL